MWWKSDDYTWWWDVPQPPTGWELYHSRNALPDGSIFVANNKSSGSLYVYTLTDGDPTWTVADGIAAKAPNMDSYQLNPSTLLGSNIIRVCVSETNEAGVPASVLPTGAHELFWAPSSVVNVPETHQGSTLNTTLWNDTGETISESNAFSVWLPDSQCYAGTITVTANPETPSANMMVNGGITGWFTVRIYSGETVVGLYNPSISSAPPSFDPWNDSGIIHFQVPNDSPWGITKVVLEWSAQNLHFVLADPSSLVQSYTVRRTQSRSMGIPVYHWGFPCQSSWAFGVHWKARPRITYGLGWSSDASSTYAYRTIMEVLSAYPVNPTQYPLQSWEDLATVPEGSPLLQSWIVDSTGTYVGDTNISWVYYDTFLYDVEGNGSTDTTDSACGITYYCGRDPDENNTTSGNLWLRSKTYPNRVSPDYLCYGSRSAAGGWNLNVANTFVLSPGVTTTPVFGYIFGLGTEYISDPVNIRNMTEYAEVYIYPPSHIEELPPNSESVYGPNLKIHYTIPTNFLRKSNIIYRATYTSLGSASPPYHYTHAITVTNSWNSEEVTHMVGAPGLQEGTFNGSFSASGITTDQHWILFSVPTAAGTLAVERTTLTPSDYTEYPSITWGNGDGSAGFSITAT